jgi:hypothetical protein
LYYCLNYSVKNDRSYTDGEDLIELKRENRLREITFSSRFAPTDIMTQVSYDVTVILYKHILLRTENEMAG